MRRLNKLYEAKAVASQARSQLMLGFIHLGFDKATREALSPQAAAISKQLEAFIETIEGLIEVENLRVKNENRSAYP